MRLLRTLIVCTLMPLWLGAAALPPGKQVRVRLGQTISSESAHNGEAWQGTLASPLVVDGRTVAPRGAAVRGVVAEARPSGRLSTPGLLRLRLTSIQADGQAVAVRSGLVSRQAASHKGRNAKLVGGGAALGGIIGAIAGGGKGAAIGLGAGAAAGTAGAAATGKKNVRLPAETVLTFTLR